MDDEQRARIRAEHEELLTARLDESLLKRAAGDSVVTTLV